MRESMAQLTPRFSASRAVGEYAEQHYLPAAAHYRERAAGKGALGKQVVDWRQAVDRAWGSLRFGAFRVESNADQHVFEVEIFLNDLDPKAVRVELFADGANGGEPVRVEMKCAGEPSDASRGCVHRATVPSARPASDYTPRAIPQHAGVAVPLESGRILWQR
jgi:starch phosphorylase